MSRSFKNALVRRLVCDGALSSCHHQLDVSVPMCAMQCGKYTSSSIRMLHSALMRTPSSMKHGGKTMPFTIAALTMVPGLRLLCSSMHASGSRICLSCGPPVGSNHPNRTVLRWSLVVPAEELLVREQNERQVQGLQMQFVTDREHSHALEHVTAKVQPCQAVLRCRSWRTDRLATRLRDLRATPATASSATYPASCADGARSAVASRSRPLQSRPTLPSFAAVSADGIRLAHLDADA